MHAKTCNMAEGLEEDEEEYLLQQNLDLIPLFNIHLDKIMSKGKATFGEGLGENWL